MISFELHTPPTTTSRATVLAAVHVADGACAISDPHRLLDLSAVHGSPRVEGGVYFESDPEEWARAALATFNAPDLVPANVHDTAPWDVPVFEDLTPRFAHYAVSHEYALRAHVAAH